MPINAPQTIPGLQSWAGFYGGNVSAPQQPPSVFGALQQGAPPATGVPYSGGWTNPQTWANYYGGQFGFQAPQNAGTPAGALGAQLQNPNDPALLGWEQDFGNPNSILQNSKNWAQSLGAPPTSGQYNQGTGGWANPASWAAYYGGKEGFTAPPQAGTPAAALAAAAALSHSSPLDPNLLGWEQNFGQPAQILSNTANWAASLGAPPTNGNYNQGIGAWESPLAWAAYYGGIQGYSQPVDNTLQAAQNFLGFTNKNDPSLLGWELDYGDPQTVVSVIEAQQAAIAAQQAAQQAAQRQQQHQAGQQQQATSEAQYQQQLAAYNAQIAAYNQQIAAQQAAAQRAAAQQAQENQEAQTFEQLGSALQATDPTAAAADFAAAEGLFAQARNNAGIESAALGQASAEQAQQAALQAPAPFVPATSTPQGSISGGPPATQIGFTNSFGVPGEPGAIQPGSESALALSLGLPSNTSPTEIQATEIANASGAGQGYIQLIESNLRQGFPPLTNVFSPARGPGGLAGPSFNFVGADYGTNPTIAGFGGVAGSPDTGFNATLNLGPNAGVTVPYGSQFGGFGPPSGLGIGSIGGGATGSFDVLEFGAPNVAEFGGPPGQTIQEAIQGLPTTDLGLSPPPEIGAPDLMTLFDPFSGVQYPTTPPPVFGPESPSIMLPPLPPDMNLPLPTPLSPSQQLPTPPQQPPTELPEIVVSPEGLSPQVPYIALPDFQSALVPLAPEPGQPPAETLAARDFPDFAFQTAFEQLQQLGTSQQLGPSEGFPPVPPLYTGAPTTPSEQFVEEFGTAPTLRQVLTAASKNGTLPDGTDLNYALGKLGEGVDTPINLTGDLQKQIYDAINGPSGVGLVAGVATPKLLQSLTDTGKSIQGIADAASDILADIAEPPPQPGPQFQTSPDFLQNVPFTYQPGQFLAGLPQEFTVPNLGQNYQPIEAAPADLGAAGYTPISEAWPGSGSPESIDDRSYIDQHGGHSTLGYNKEAGPYGAFNENEEFSSRLAAAGQAYEALTGNPPVYGEGDRDTATQQAYYDESTGHGAHARTFAVAYPGQSLHQQGTAMDIPAGPFATWLQQNGMDYGLSNPVPNDPNHFQMQDLKGGQYPYGDVKQDTAQDLIGGSAAYSPIAPGMPQQFYGGDVPQGPPPVQGFGGGDTTAPLSSMDIGAMLAPLPQPISLAPEMQLSPAVNQALFGAPLPTPAPTGYEGEGLAPLGEGLASGVTGYNQAIFAPYLQALESSPAAQAAMVAMINTEIGSKGVDAANMEVGAAFDRMVGMGIPPTPQNIIAEFTRGPGGSYGTVGQNLDPSGIQYWQTPGKTPSDENAIQNLQGALDVLSGGQNLTYLPGVGPATGSGSYQFKSGGLTYPNAGTSLPITAGISPSGVPLSILPPNFSRATPGVPGAEYFVQEGIVPLNAWIGIFNQIAPNYVPGSPL